MAASKTPKAASVARAARPGKAKAPSAAKAPAAPAARNKDKAPSSAAAAKPEKPRKPKLVRDSFTIPKTEYRVIEESKARAASLGRQVKKSELLRAGLKALAAMGDSAFVGALDAVPALKTGRPAKT